MISYLAAPQWIWATTRALVLQRTVCSAGAWRITTRCWEQREKWTFCQSQRRITSWRMGGIVTQARNISVHLQCSHYHRLLPGWVALNGFLSHADDPSEQHDDGKELESLSAGSNSPAQCSEVSADSDCTLTESGQCQLKGTNRVLNIL